MVKLKSYRLCGIYKYKKVANKKHKQLKINKLKKY